MALQGKLVAEITREDVLGLLRVRAAEDALIDFKQIIFPPGHKRPDDEAHDLLADLVAFANALGGHIVVGIEEDGHGCASQLRPISQAEATRIATKLKALAIQHIKPPVVLLEVIPFRMDDFADQWVVIVSVPQGQSKPHMSAYRSGTVFTIRDGNRKRSMTADEIQNAFLAGPQQSSLASIYRELQSVRALVESVGLGAGQWWKFW